VLYAQIDAREKAEQALRQSQRLESIGQLTGGVAHDFNNLLTIILGNLEGLQRQLGESDGKAKRRIENAIHDAQRAATLTKRLLAFSRQQPLSPAPINVNQLMNGLADFLRRALGEHIEIEVVGAAGLWPVEIDPAELESALVNLAVNARDAMPSGGKLTIEATNSFLDETYCRNHHDVDVAATSTFIARSVKGRRLGCICADFTERWPKQRRSLWCCTARKASACWWLKMTPVCVAML
jgi:signal transduction histidine kinase